MEGPLDMNDHRITGLINNVLNLTEATNKRYVDNAIIKGKLILNKVILLKTCFSISWMMLMNGLQNVVLFLLKLMTWIFLHIIGIKNVYL